MDKGYPLVLVFYLDRELMMQPQIFRPYANAVNQTLIDREANAMAFFIPTDGTERVECINPLVVPEDKIDEIYKTIESLKATYDIGQIDLEDGE
jgi:hypothetical protein